MRRPVRSATAAAAAWLVVLAGCVTAPTPEPTPAPTTFPAASPDAAAEVASAYLAAWSAGDWAAMYDALDPDERARYPVEAFEALHTTFAEMTQVRGLETSTGTPEPTALPPEPRAPAFPAPSPTPAPTADPSASAGAASPAATPAPSIDPAAPIEGPTPALAVPVELRFDTARFGELDLDRSLTLVQGPAGWLVRWSPEVLFSELGADGTLRLDRALGTRGRIVGPDGLVWAETREDGVRVYPQEALAGQVIGYVGEVTAEDLERLGTRGYRTGDVVGRSGIEAGAEDLLRGTPGWTLVAVAADGSASVLERTEMTPGADVAITIRPAVQLAAQQALANHAEGATAAIDPRSGDVWALASSPAFNPNAMALGATLEGVPLQVPGSAAIFDKAVLGTYPAGSSFKPFTLVAALTTGTVTPSSTRTCPPTWEYNGFTFHNYKDHTLPGQVTLAQAMAFSCNTTYMPLAYEVYQRDESALVELLKDFGFGAATGLRYLAEETGIVPDDDWLREHGRGGYSGFEQVQLAIGQGAFLGTPLQLANAYAAIGNGGTLWTPRIVMSATLPDGTVVDATEPTIAHTIPATREDLAFVTDTLQAVVTLPYGTGTAAFAGFGVPVAGKSGTAENGTPDPHAWFPAYAPADDPTIAVATVLPYITLGTGGTDAAPLVRRVMAAHFADG
jgi:penicillin-binding protein 2